MKSKDRPRKEPRKSGNGKRKDRSKEKGQKGKVRK